MLTRPQGCGPLPGPEFSMRLWAPTQTGEGLFVRGFTTHGKPGAAADVGGARSRREGLHDATGWFAGHPDMAGEQFGCNSPCPPFNDSRVRRSGTCTLHRRLL